MRSDFYYILLYSYLAENIIEGTNTLARVHMQFNNIIHKKHYVQYFFDTKGIITWWFESESGHQRTDFHFRKCMFLTVKNFFIMHGGKQQDSDVSPFLCLPFFLHIYEDNLPGHVSVWFILDDPDLAGELDYMILRDPFQALLFFNFVILWLHLHFPAKSKSCSGWWFFFSSLKLIEWWFEYELLIMK